MDRCYMQIRCRPQDAPRFEALDFILSTPEDGDSCVILIDAESSYALDPDLPTDIPWTGASGPGDSYDAAEYACDGKDLLCVPCANDGQGYIIQWDATLNEPTDASLAALRHFFDLRERANEALDGKAEIEKAEVDDRDCTCANYSWYGEGHCSACPCSAH